MEVEVEEELLLFFCFFLLERKKVEREKKNLVERKKNDARMPTDCERSEEKMHSSKVSLLFASIKFSHLESR